MSIRKKQQPDDWEGCEEGYHIYAGLRHRRRQFLLRICKFI